MKILLFSDSNNTHFERVRNALMQTISFENIDIYSDIESLAGKLKNPGNALSLVVILSSSKEAIEKITTIKYLLCDIRIILILPNSEKETISLGHTLRPRFLCDVDSDFSEITAVVDKMMKLNLGARQECSDIMFNC